MLDLTISYNTPGTPVSTQHITIKVPNQVSFEGREPPASVTVDVDTAEFESQSGLYPDTELALESPSSEKAAPLLQ